MLYNIYSLELTHTDKNTSMTTVSSTNMNMTPMGIGPPKKASKKSSSARVRVRPKKKGTSSSSYGISAKTTVDVDVDAVSAVEDPALAPDESVADVSKVDADAVKRNDNGSDTDLAKKQASKKVTPSKSSSSNSNSVRKKSSGGTIRIGSSIRRPVDISNKDNSNLNNKNINDNHLAEHDRESSVGGGNEVSLSNMSYNNDKLNESSLRRISMGLTSVVLPPLPEGAKSLKDFCRSYVDPEEEVEKGSKLKKRKKSGDATTKLSNDVASTSNKVARNHGSHDNDSTIGSAPMVELVDGEIVIRESSLEVGGGASNIVEDEYEEVHEGAGEMTATYTSFTDKLKSKRWSIEETKLFYNALRQVGSDFSTMMAFFPDRDRRQLRNKFKRESRKNPRLIKLALEGERLAIGKLRRNLVLHFICITPY